MFSLTLALSLPAADRHKGRGEYKEVLSRKKLCRNVIVRELINRSNPVMYQKQEIATLP